MSLLVSLLLVVVAIVVIVINTSQYRAVSCSNYDVRIEQAEIICCAPAKENDYNIANSNSPGTVSGSICVDEDAAAAEVIDSPNDNLQKVIDFFSSKGELTPKQVAGIAGNAKVESGLDPAKIQGGAIAPKGYKPVPGVGFGLFQWTDGERQRCLAELARLTGRDITDLYLQLDFAWSELQSGYAGALSRVKLAKTPEDAAVYFHDHYLGSGDSRKRVIVSRGGNAEEIYRSRRFVPATP